MRANRAGAEGVALAAALLLLVSQAGCQKEPPPEPLLQGPENGAQPQASSRPNPARSPAHPLAARVNLMTAPEGGDVAAIVRRELERAKGDGRELVVYVGAVWCEPCQRFHEAAAAGALDGVLPRMRLLEFDHDRDKERLAQAGYSSRLIPLLAMPKGDGQASGQQIEGGHKGEGAAREIAARLAELVAKTRAAER